MSSGNESPGVIGRRGFLKRILATTLITVMVETSAILELPVQTREVVFERLVIPLVRSVFPRLIAEDIIQVQPLATTKRLTYEFDLEIHEGPTPPGNWR